MSRKITDEEIKAKEKAMAYWRKCSDEARTDGAALTAFGVYAGLRMSLREMIDARTAEEQKPDGPSE